MFKYRVINNKFYNFYDYNNSDSIVYGFAKTSGFLEPRLYKRLKLILRRIHKRFRGSTPVKKKMFSRYFVRFKRFNKMWFFLRPNYIFSKKSTNSRMGKGKGKFKRWLIRVKRGDLIFKIHGTSFFMLYRKFMYKYNKSFRIRLIIHNNTHRVFRKSVKKRNTWLIFDQFRFN